METKRINWTKHLGIVLAALVFVVQAILVPYVGMSWDEPSSFFVGRANLKFWLSGNRAYLDDLKNKELFADSPIQYIYGEDVYPPLVFTIASATSYVFAEKLHVLDVYDAHHLAEVAVGALGVWAMYGLALSAGLSVPASLGVGLAYALYPSIWGPMRNDAKDVPLVSMLVVAAYCFMRLFTAWTQKPFGLTQGKKQRDIVRSAIAFGVALGLAGGTKPTAAIIVPIILVWLVVASVKSRTFRKKIGPAVPLAALAIIVGLVSLIVFFLVWPWLWVDPVGKLVTVWSFFKTSGYNMLTPFLGRVYHAAVDLPKIYPLAILVFQTPIEITLFAVAGLLWALWRFIKRDEALPLLFAVWFVVGMGRFFIPGFIIHAGRHFIDVMPAFFVLMGFGIDAVGQFLARKHVVLFHNKQFWTYVIAVIMIVHEASISIEFFPYELSYFNVLVGGTSNVAKKQLFDVGQASGIKEGMEFIARDSGGKPVAVYPCLMGHVMILYVPANVTLTGHPELADYTMAPNSVSWFRGTLDFGKKFHETAYVVSRAGADLFYVFRYKEPIGWRCGWETKTTYEYYYENPQPEN